MIDVLERAGVGTRPTYGTGEYFRQCHFTGRRDDRCIYQDTGVAIIPLRNREEVMASWMRRRKNLQNLDDAWAEMEDFIGAGGRDIYLIHIDDPKRRESELHAVSDRLGLVLDADFDVMVGHGK